MSFLTIRATGHMLGGTAWQYYPCYLSVFLAYTLSK
jgi:hypothetical protein